MKLRKFASIDIGSNAVRLLFVNVIENNNDPVFRKSSIIRMPVRLGDDVFEHGYISQKKMDKLCETMLAFKHLMKVQDVITYRACATSAMREASNSEEVVGYVKEKTGVSIDVISGAEEAEMIFSASDKTSEYSIGKYLYVDVGGGSTELTLFIDGEIITSNSFNIGTIRLLKKKIHKGEKDQLKDWLKTVIKSYKPDAIIGSGGNINRYFKISGKKEGKPLTYYHLLEIYESLSSYSYNDRIKVLGLNPDRADVIIPAGETFLSIMKWSGVKKIFIPKTGLSDGIVRKLYTSDEKKLT